MGGPKTPASWTDDVGTAVYGPDGKLIAGVERPRPLPPPPPDPALPPARKRR